MFLHNFLQLFGVLGGVGRYAKQTIRKKEANLVALFLIGQHDLCHESDMIITP
ncbi:hypothetical protein DJ66_0427 [Candidatus Liberibacter solanacearum]|uniref:Uncharacterized protein n=1 Tax=Candidatus Liberibacter solanacearum TaxID=556287 RepID=A0A0F4VKE4_9HYPH|nr:hypothetical protein [Candidatus Liberibacter solanacearum]KJZ81705.1 hypothetical protein DJ66_0427 [Candidatus Liberibacter solanacearum]